MMISPELSNSATVLHVLKYKASLPVLIAMCMPDCPRPVKVKWLDRRTGVARQTIEDSLIYLMDALKLVFRTGIKRGSAWWLSDGVRQLPLPFVQHLREIDTRPFNLIESGQQTSRLPDHPAIDGGSGRPRADHRATDREQGQQSHLSIMSKKTSLSTVVVDHVFKDHDHDLLNDQQQHTAIMPKKTALLLHWMGVDEPLPTQFADADPAWPLSCYWYSMVCEFGNPAGYVAKRLRTNNVCPAPYPKMARTWLDLDEERQLILLDAAGDLYARATGRMTIPPDFGVFVPYREFRLVYEATGGELVPPEMMPVDEGVDN